MRPATRTALARGALAALANAERLLTDEVVPGLVEFEWRSPA
jgi:hypothetical protein